MRRITIDWSYPMEFEHILLDSRMEDIGIYYITRRFGDKVSDLYIGKTIHSFYSRLKDHEKKWIDRYRGTKQVRLGTIVSPKRMSPEERKALIEDAEKTLIFLQHPKYNTQCQRGCALEHRLLIKNTGYRGNLPAEMIVPDENWIENEESERTEIYS